MRREKVSDLLFIFWAGGAALLSYALVYALRKPFTAATFDGLDFMGMDYKTATSIIQIAGYVLSKFMGIKWISELRREDRLRFIIASVSVAELSLLSFALLPVPYNVCALFFNGLSLGCMWGVIFSFIEGRRLTGILASIMGISIAFSSGLAKSLGLFLMNDLRVDCFWMPAVIGGFAFVLIILLAFILNALPAPSEEDIRSCTKRVPMDARQRKAIFFRFAPLLLMLFVANLFITIIRDVKEDFLVNIVDTSQFSAWAISGIDGMVTLIILALFILVSMIRDHQRVLYTLLWMVIGGTFLLVGIFRAILSMPDVTEKFTARYHRMWNEEDVNEMYQSFEKHLFASLTEFTDPIPGVVETLEGLRAQGIRIGSTTGYTGAMMDIVRPGAEAKGYRVDNLVTPDSLPAGRPAPYMIFQNMIDLRIPSVQQVVKVGDTLADIREGVNAGVWSVGLITGSNEMGLTEEEYNRCPADELAKMKADVRRRMLDAGAHRVLDNIRELPAYIAELNASAF